MSSPKPHIKPKAEPHRKRSEPALRDPPSFPDWDPPVFSPRDPGADPSEDERVIFREDHCLG